MNKRVSVTPKKYVPTVTLDLLEQKLNVQHKSKVYFIRIDKLLLDH